MPARKVCIITSAHPVFNTRVFHKQAKSLVQAGYDVTLIAQHDQDEMVDGVQIVALPKPKGRLQRMLGLPWKAFFIARRQKYSVYHFHDPELLPIGILLKITTRAKVIYDVHENYPQAIRVKEWIPVPLRWPVASATSLVELVAARALDAIVCATGSIRSRFRSPNAVVVGNYPFLGSTESGERRTSFNSRNTVIFVGHLSRIRGIGELVRAMGMLEERWCDVRLNLVGDFGDPNFEAQIRELKEFYRVDYQGWIPYRDVRAQLERASIGMVLFHPVPNHTDAMPNKLFEYMEAGLPVIASNFPLWKEIVEANHCGLTVDPLDPPAIAGAIDYLLAHATEAAQMGHRGRQAVLEKYNWAIEKAKLLQIYEDLLNAA